MTTAIPTPAVRGGGPAGFCVRCGQDLGAGPTGGDHPGCRSGLRWEPPRFCPGCGRRLVVQVLPTGWTARCAEHGSLG